MNHIKIEHISKTVLIFFKISYKPYKIIIDNNKHLDVEEFCFPGARNLLLSAYQPARCLAVNFIAITNRSCSLKTSLFFCLFKDAHWVELIAQASLGFKRVAPCCYLTSQKQLDANYIEFKLN